VSNDVRVGRDHRMCHSIQRSRRPVDFRRGDLIPNPILQSSSRGITTRYIKLAAAALLGMIALPALAQMPPGSNLATGVRPGHEPGAGVSLPLSNKASNIGPTDTRSTIIPTLPSPAIGEAATTQDYLNAARSALVAGHAGRAQRSLEMAETRALDRSVEPGQMSAPSDSQLVARIRDARHALGSADRAHAIQLIDLALSI